jgi:hypothetical protein
LIDESKHFAARAFVQFRFTSMIRSQQIVIAGLDPAIYAIELFGDDMPRLRTLDSQKQPLNIARAK